MIKVNSSVVSHVKSMKSLYGMMRIVLALCGLLPANPSHQTISNGGTFYEIPDWRAFELSRSPKTSQVGETCYRQEEPKER